jgi:hypothetical protein
MKVFKKSVWQMNPDGIVLVLEECESFDYEGPLARAMPAYLYQPPIGIPGVVSRPDAPNDVITKVFGATAFVAYGLPVQLSSSTVIPISATGQAVFGILVRPFPRQGLTVSDGTQLGSATPPTAGPADVMRKGYITVFNRNGTPTEGGNVYIRFQNPSGSKIVGGIEATSTADTYQLTGWSFMGAADTNGNVEISSN